MVVVLSSQAPATGDPPQLFHNKFISLEYRLWCVSQSILDLGRRVRLVELYNYFPFGEGSRMRPDYFPHLLPPDSRIGPRPPSVLGSLGVLSDIDLCTPPLRLRRKEGKVWRSEVFRRRDRGTLTSEGLYLTKKDSDKWNPQQSQTQRSDRVPLQKI